MRSVLIVLGLIVAGLALAGESAPAPSNLQFKPRTYALVSAIGASFSMVTEVMSTGSHLEPYQRRSVDVPDDMLNRLVLADLDKQVQAMDPEGKRVYLAYPAARLPRVPADRREQAAIDAVVAELRRHDERSGWDRVIVVTQAYRAADRDDMGTKLQGLGVFIEPMCQSDPSSCDSNSRPPSGPKAMRPDGSIDMANSFVAPFTYITVWELDPATLTVLARLPVFSHQKLMGEDNQTGRVLRDMDKKRLASQVVKLIGLSIHDALRQTDLVGHVEVRPVKDAAPEPAK